jgi:hypothetical protein
VRVIARATCDIHIFVRIDLLTEISRVRFDEAESSRLEASVSCIRLAFLGKEALVTDELAGGRNKDLVDAQAREPVAVPPDGQRRNAPGLSTGGVLLSRFGCGGWI